jgi:hypothetical protein
LRREVRSAKQSQFGGARRREKGVSCTNKPNLGKPGWDPRGRLRQTKPIAAMPGGRGPGGRGPRRAEQTNPIRREQQEGQVPGGKRVMVDWTCTRPRPNKANLPRRTEMGVGQPSDQQRCRLGRLRQTNSIRRRWASDATPQGAMAPNKANFGGLAGWTRGAVVQTKPIPPGRAGRGLGGEARPIVRKKPNLPRAQEWARAAGTGKLPRGPIVPNEPNSRQTGKEDHRQGQRPQRCHPVPSKRSHTGAWVRGNSVA